MRALDLTNTWAVTLSIDNATCNWVFAQTGSDLTADDFGPFFAGPHRGVSWTIGMVRFTLAASRR